MMLKHSNKKMIFEKSLREPQLVAQIDNKETPPPPMDSQTSPIFRKIISFILLMKIIFSS